MRSTRTLGLLAAVAIAAAVVSCSTGTTDAKPASGGDGAFPVTIENAYGTTTIAEKPKRVATVAWANHEVPLALGIVPVGMSIADWGDDDGDGILPWDEAQLKKLGGTKPVIFDDTDGIDYEAVADTKPDVILASYSGLTKEEYQTLSKIAPVVSFPKVAWGTSMDDMIRLNSTALGMKRQGDELIDRLHGEIRSAFAKHPELEGTRILFAYADPTDLSKIGFYTTHDTRPAFLKSLGLPVPKEVAAATRGTEEFFTTVSAEEADRFSDVDLIVTYGGDSTAAQLRADPLWSKIPAVARGSIAVLPDGTPLAASANPSPLSIEHDLDGYLGALASALK